MRLDAEAEQEAWEHIENTWVLVVREAESRARGFGARLADRKQTPDIDAVRSLQAQIDACKWLIGLPRRKLDGLKEKR